MILGVLAGIVIPNFASATDDSRKTAFVREMRVFTEAVLRYELEHEALPPDGGSGSVPAGLDAYVDVGQWEAGTPIGGVWDNETDDLLGAGVGVHFNGTGQTRDAEYMSEIDRIVDDGDVNAGSFRIFGDRYYTILRE